MFRELGRIQAPSPTAWATETEIFFCIDSLIERFNYPEAELSSTVGGLVASRKFCRRLLDIYNKKKSYDLVSSVHFAGVTQHFTYDFVPAVWAYTCFPVLLMIENQWTFTRTYRGGRIFSRLLSCLAQLKRNPPPYPSPTSPARRGTQASRPECRVHDAKGSGKVSGSRWQYRKTDGPKVVVRLRRDNAGCPLVPLITG